MIKRILKIKNNRDWELKRLVARHQKKRVPSEYIGVDDLSRWPIKRLHRQFDRYMIAKTDITGLDSSEEEN